MLTKAEMKEFTELQREYVQTFSLNSKKKKKMSKRRIHRFLYLDMCRKCALRNEYGPLWDYLKNVLHRYDLEDLKSSQCPYDEYEYEVELILPKLKKLYVNKKTQIKRKDVEEIIDGVFRKTFSHSRKSSAYPSGHFSKVSNEITDFLNGKTITFSINSIEAMNSLL